MRLLRSSWTLLRIVFFLTCLAVDFVLRPVAGMVDGATRVHRCCRRIVRALGIEWSIEGELPQDGAVISNHLSYLDILVFAAVQPFVMVAKSEVRRWPLIGWMTARAGTVFVVRGGGPATYPAVNRAMAEAYRSGLPVLFFPEGTTTDGSEVLPFRRGLFHSVLNEGAALRPAALSYALDEQDCERGATVANDVCWWGDALLAPHLFQFAGMKGARAKIRFGEAINERLDRFELSAHARDRVTRMVAELGRGASRTMTHAHEAELAEAL